MKKTITLFVLILMLFALASCDFSVNKKKNEPTVTQTQTTNSDGSVTNTTKVEYDNGNATIDENTTFTDGSDSQKHTEEIMNDKGDVTIESKETITYSDTNTSGKKKEVIETSEHNDAVKGACKESKTTIDFKDGSKEISSSKEEGRTGYKETSVEKIATDGSSTKEVKIFETNDQNPDNPPYSGTNTSTKKDSSGKITEEVKVEYETQKKEFTSDHIKSVTTSTIYKDGQPDSIIVETLRPALGGINSGSYIKEIKNANSQTISKEMEFYFYDSNNQNCKKIIFKDDGISKKAKITKGSLDNGTVTHKTFVTNLLTFDTVFTKTENSITIASEVYTLDADLTLSFDSKF